LNSLFTQSFPITITFASVQKTSCSFQNANIKKGIKFIAKSSIFNTSKACHNK
jgi:hypothetical protein